MKRYLALIISILLLINLVIWSQDFLSAQKTNQNLTVAYLDIGQGDAIYIEAPNGNQIIIDGGPNTALMSVLPKVMPYGDKSIDAIIITNPDADHMSGFVPLLEEYDIGFVVEPGTKSDTTTYKNIEQEIEKKNILHILARKGMKIVLDKEKNVYFEILFPDRDVSSWERNDGSIVGNLVYGENKFLFMGDATLLTEGIVLAENDLSGTDVLKLGHHGSHTSTGVPLLREARPELGIISAGLNNRYGHPHKDVIGRLSLYEIPYFLTSTEGTIILSSDGKNIVKK